MRSIGVSLSSAFVIFIVLLWFSHKLCDASLHVGVLSHDHFRTEISEGSSHDRNLLGCDVIDFDEEALLVVTAGLLEGIPSPFLSLTFSFLWHFCLCKNAS